MHRDASTTNFFSKADLRVVLVAPRNPLNIGAAARAMANFGCARLRVVNAYEVALREARSAMGAAPVALLFGSEKFGLSDEDMSYCHWLMRIPTVDLNLSMNLGQAVAVCLYE